MHLFGGYAKTSLLLLSPWFVLLGSLVALRASPAIGRATYGLFMSAACTLALAAAADNDDVLAMGAEWTSDALFAGCFVIFFLTFPAPRGTSLRRMLLFVPPSVGVVLGLASLQWSSLYDVAYLARMAVLLIYLLAGAGLLISSFKRAREGDARRGLTIISAGTVASIAPFASLYLVPVLLHRSPLLSAETAILALALLPASFAYAILRHNVLNIQLLQRWLVHGLLWGVLIALFLAIADGLRYVADAVLDRPECALFVFGVLVLLVGLAFRRPYDKLQRVLDRRIFKDAYDYGASLEGLSRDLSLVGGLDTLGNVLPSKLQQLMNLDIAVLLVSDAGDIRECGTAGEYRSATRLALVAAVRDARTAPQIVPLANHGPFLLVPLQTRNELVGYLCLGPKLSGEPFRPEDYALLTTLSGHLAAIVRNAQLVDELRAQIGLLQAQKATLNTLNERLQYAHEEERARIGADLHGGVANSAASTSATTHRWAGACSHGRPCRRH